MKTNHYFDNASYWNKLVRKFSNLNDKIRRLIFTKNTSATEVNILLSRLKKIYKKLKSLQVKVGIKVAGSALALMLATTSLNAQDFTSEGNVIIPGLADVDVSWAATPVFADIDKDGDLDLYVGEKDGYIKVFTNDGNGNFLVNGNLKADGNDIDVGMYSSPVFADLDNDGDLDLFVGESNGHIKVYLNDENGNYTSNGNLQADGIDINVGTIPIPKFADLDNDGDMDLYVGRYYGDIKVFINDGNGNFTEAGNLQADGVDIDGGNVSMPEFADLDNDGDLDLYLGDDSGKIQVYLNDGSGNFTANGFLQADGSDIDVGIYFAFPTFADIDDDGDLDLYVGDFIGYINVFTNDGNGNFTASGHLQDNAGNEIDVGWNSAPECADLDNNGTSDLYIGNEYGKIKIYVNDSTGNFVANGFLQADGTDIDVSMHASPVFADLDSDGDLDLYVGNEDGVIKVFLNDGDNNFTENGNLQANTGMDIDVGKLSTPVFADIDKDGDLDLYIGEKYGHIKVFINDGNGNFTSNGNLQADGTDIDVGDYATPVFADLDNDDDFDLFVGESNGHIKVYLNDENGNFTANGYLQADGNDIYVGRNASPVFTDIDNDGDLDLYVGNYNGTVKKYKNHEINTSLPQIEKSDLDITVYPNPTTGILTINLEESARVFNCEVIDINGRLIKSYKNISSDNLQIDLSNQSKGLYFLKVYNDELVKNVKIILE